MTDVPEITVVIPVYNTAKYLKACLDSVLSQSLSDFEIVAVNDASTDDSPRILSEYASKDARVRIVDHVCNKGLLSVRLSGIRAARGKYLLFLDSDDVFRPGFLNRLWTAAEKHQADIVHFPMEVRDRDHTLPPRLVRLAAKRSRPYRGEMHGREVFRKYFIENACSWSAVQKMYRTDLCRKAAEFIPDQFCLTGEDFCFYTVCAFLAEHYVPLRFAGYVYYLDSGISSSRTTTLERFLHRQSPVPALVMVRDFLRRQGAWEEYVAAFMRQVPRIFTDPCMSWMRYLPAADRTAAFNALVRQLGTEEIFTAFRAFFDGRDEHFLDLLTGEDSKPVPAPGKMNRIGRGLPVRDSRISLKRWREWGQLIEENHYDAVILEPDENFERLFWDNLAVRSFGAAAICRCEKYCLNMLDCKDLRRWLQEDRVLRQASAVLTADEASAEWLRRRGCYAGTTPDTIRPPEKDPRLSALMSALEQSELTAARYRIDPSPDGETFVPFFRKLDRLFRKLPDGFRRKTFGMVSRLYRRIRGY